MSAARRFEGTTPLFFLSGERWEGARTGGVIYHPACRRTRDIDLYASTSCQASPQTGILALGKTMDCGEP